VVDVMSQFDYNSWAFGGTEYMARKVNSDILPKLTNVSDPVKYLLMTAPGPEVNWSVANEEIILWIHNLMHQFSGQNFAMSAQFRRKLKYIIAVSEFQKNKLKLQFPNHEIFVCNNAIEPKKLNLKKFEKVKKPNLVYFSATERGLEMLIESIKLVDEDFDLKVFCDFYPDLITDTELLKVIEDKRITFYGKTPRKTVEKYVQEAHILTYPAIFEETFCLAAVESVSAGLLPVYSNTGALPEVLDGMGVNFDWTSEFQKDLPHIFNIDVLNILKESPEVVEENKQLFANGLTNALSKIKNNEWDAEAAAQSVNTRFSWEAVEQQWLDLDKSIL
jgi:UDP-glucose:(glucosyl)LPS alpha-1,2-glucosyltransferase